VVHVIHDIEHDVLAAHIDVLKIEYVIEKPSTLKAVFYLRDIPPELNFHYEVPEGISEHQWCVYIDVDNDSSTGEVYSNHYFGVEYAICAFDNYGSLGLKSIEEGTSAWIYKIISFPFHSTWRTRGSAGKIVYLHKSKLTLWGRIDGINDNSRAFFTTSYYDVETGNIEEDFDDILVPDGAVWVPDFYDMSLEDVENWLEENGFNYISDVSSEDEFSLVVGQNPPCCQHLVPGETEVHLFAKSISELAQPIEIENNTEPMHLVDALSIINRHCQEMTLSEMMALDADKFAAEYGFVSQYEIIKQGLFQKCMFVAIGNWGRYNTNDLVPFPGEEPHYIVFQPKDDHSGVIEIEPLIPDGIPLLDVLPLAANECEAYGTSDEANEYGYNETMWLLTEEQHQILGDTFAYRQAISASYIQGFVHNVPEGACFINLTGTYEDLENIVQEGGLIPRYETWAFFMDKTGKVKLVKIREEVP